MRHFWTTRILHILPEFIYKALYDSNRKFLEVATEGGYKKSTFAKGVREHLLCRCCEARFSKLEDHAARVHREMRRKLDAAAVDDLVTVPANYEKLKLFQLSILWRAAVSKHSFSRSTGRTIRESAT